MLYVIYVGAGREKNAEACIRNRTAQKRKEKTVSMEEEGICTSCFYPVRHMRKKIRGSWTDYYERMIPGYLFVESENISGLYEELCRLPYFMKILGKEKQEGTVVFQALQEDEVRWLRGIMGENPGSARPGKDATGKDAPGWGGIGKEPVAGLSQVGFDENDQVKVLSGPLENLTGMIRKIDLHRRIAEVEVELLGRKIRIHLGIELLDRKENHG